MFIILLLCCLIIGLITFGKNWPAAPTAAGSMVMALSIFVSGVWPYMSGQSVNSLSSRLLVLGTILIWLYLLASYLTSIRRSTFYRDHLADPMRRLAIGSWATGTSVLLINVYYAFGAGWINETVHIMAVLNVVLWLFYLWSVLNGWRQLAGQSYRGELDGSVWLPATATQSIAWMIHEVFDLADGLWVSRILIALGMVMYLIGAWQLWRQHARRPRTKRTFGRWNATYVMIYGAPAIAAVTASATHAWSAEHITDAWWVILALLLVIEGREAIQAVSRIRNTGWRTGIGRYHTAQWTRLFTLGIFYVLTWYTLPLLQEGSLSLMLHRWILKGGGWLLSLLLLLELTFWLIALIRHSGQPLAESEATSNTGMRVRHH